MFHPCSMDISGFIQSLCITHPPCWHLRSDSGATEFYHYSRFTSWPIYLSWADWAHQEGCSLTMLCDTVPRKNKNPHVSVFVLTTGNGPVDQGVWCLVEDSIWCHSGTGVQHNIKSTHKETYGRGNSDKYRVMENSTSHRTGLCSPIPFHPPQQNADLHIHHHACCLML